MSDATKPGKSFRPFEFQVFSVLPLDYRLQAIGLFILLVLSFLGVATASHPDGMNAFLPGGDLLQEAELALVFSALLTLAVALQTTGHNLWRRELSAIRRAIRPEAHERLQPFETGLPLEWRKAYRRAGLIGFALGIVLNGLIIFQSSNPMGMLLQPIGIWFFLLGPVLLILGARGLTDMSYQSRLVKDLIQSEAIVALEDLEPLHVFGRMGLHEALSWSLIAVVLIVMLATGISTGGIGVLGTGLLTIALAFGGAVRSFWLAIQPVQKRIAEVKADKLRALRGDIIKAPANVGDLIALENWIASRPEWPVSAPISRRLLVYVALPLIAWAGAALVDRGISALIS